MKVINKHSVKLFLLSQNFFGLYCAAQVEPWALLKKAVLQNSFASIFLEAQLTREKMQFRLRPGGNRTWAISEVSGGEANKPRRRVHNILCND